MSSTSVHIAVGASCMENSLPEVHASGQMQLQTDSIGCPPDVCLVLYMRTLHNSGLMSHTAEHVDAQAQLFVSCKAVPSAQPSHHDLFWRPLHCWCLATSACKAWSLCQPPHHLLSKHDARFVRGHCRGCESANTPTAARQEGTSATAAPFLMRLSKQCPPYRLCFQSRPAQFTLNFSLKKS